MKKLVFGFLALLLFAVSASAQSKGDAQKAFNQYKFDNSKKAELKNAMTAIDQAVQTEEGKNDIKTWDLRGEIYNEIANQILVIRQTGLGDESELPQVENPALEAFHSYMKALELPSKKPDKGALSGLANVQGNLSNIGIFKYESGDYDQAYQSFKAVLDAHEALKKNGEKSNLDNPDDYNNQLYITGLAALNANNIPAAKPYFMKLYDMKYDKPTIYEAMYKIKAEEEGPEAAYQYLETGREKYPDDVTLLFADINHALRTNQLDKLIAKLKTAIEKEPNNLTLYTTTGNVYDQLYQKATQAGDQAKADEYFNNAFEYYNKGMEIDKGNFDATYSLGTLFYNKAAAMTQELNKLADDYSKEGVKKYEALKAKIFEQFDKALPYFQNCEKIDPNDTNTLIALKEIYARKDQLDVSNEFKKRLDNVQNGGKNAESYFKNN